MWLGLAAVPPAEKPKPVRFGSVTSNCGLGMARVIDDLLGVAALDHTPAMQDDRTRLTAVVHYT